MIRSSLTSSRSSAFTLVLAVLACCGGTAGAAGLALEWLDAQPSQSWGVPLVLAVLVVAALGFVAWAVLRQRRAAPLLHGLPTLVLAPEPRDDDRAPPRVLRVALPMQQAGAKTRSPDA